MQNRESEGRDRAAKIQIGTWNMTPANQTRKTCTISASGKSQDRNRNRIFNRFVKAILFQINRLGERIKCQEAGAPMRHVNSIVGALLDGSHRLKE